MELQDEEKIPHLELFYVQGITDFSLRSLSATSLVFQNMKDISNIFKKCRHFNYRIF